MKKITIILALLFVGLIQAQPQITFEQEIIDYGRIEKGSDGVRIFKFTNTGNETLIIENINTTPDLSIINKPIGDIIPGGSSIIEVEYDTNMMVKSLF